VVALTSISEGFPYTVVEAMACGRTVVCTDVGGVSEAVGDAGIVVPPRDIAAVADGCLRLLEDDDLRHDLAAKARTRVLGPLHPRAVHPRRTATSTSTSPTRS